MKCLVLGGGGFLGSHLCDALLSDGHKVRIFDRPNLRRYRSFKDHELVEWVDGDFVNPYHIEEAVSGCDVIYHLVSTTLPRSSNENPAYDVETNVAGTLRLLESARTNGIRKVIFASSGGTVYGVPHTIPIQESHSTDPICSYGIAKLAIEKYLALYKHLYGLDYCVLRLANPYGERQRISTAQGAVIVFLHRALRNEAIEIWGDGSVVRDYFYISDAVSALVKAMAYDGEPRIFNIGSGSGLSLNDILTAIEQLLGHHVNRIYQKSRPFDVPTNILDISRADRLLKWQPKVSLTDGLVRMEKWMQGNVF